jgi:hypothetical protein
LFAAVSSNFVGSFDDGNKYRIISYRDQKKGQIPSRIMVRLTSSGGVFMPLGITTEPHDFFICCLTKSKFIFVSAVSSAYRTNSMIYIRQFFGFITVELAYSTFKIILGHTHFFCSGVTVVFGCEIGIGSGVGLKLGSAGPPAPGGGPPGGSGIKDVFGGGGSSIVARNLRSAIS